MKIYHWFLEKIKKSKEEIKILRRKQEEEEKYVTINREYFFEIEHSIHKLATSPNDNLHLTYHLIWNKARQLVVVIIILFLKSFLPQEIDKVSHTPHLEDIHAVFRSLCWFKTALRDQKWDS